MTDDDLELDQRDHVIVQTRVEVKWWAIVISVGASLLSAILALVMAVAVRAESRRVACASIVAQDETYRDAPPPSDTGKLNAKKMRELRANLGCPPHEGN